MVELASIESLGLPEIRISNLSLLGSETNAANTEGAPTYVMSNWDNLLALSELSTQLAKPTLGTNPKKAPALL